MSRPFDLAPLGPVLGAEVGGLDLARGLDAPTAAALLRALGDHGVLVFRDQRLSPEEHLAVARALGPIVVNRYFAPVAGHPEIAEVRKEPEHATNIGGQWHTDHAYDDAPALGSLLYAREVPPLGGDTLFASMYAVHDALSPGLRAMLAGQRAVHGNHHVYSAAAMKEAGEERATRFPVEGQSRTREAVHPCIVRHPVSGRPVLYVNPQFTRRFEGWTEEESAPLLQHLAAFGIRPEFVLRLAWRPGTLAIWDNRCTWHKAVNDYPGHRRLMHRITLAGVPLEAAA